MVSKRCFYFLLGFLTGFLDTSGHTTSASKCRDLLKGQPYTIQVMKNCPTQAALLTWKACHDRGTFSQCTHFVRTHTDWPWLIKIKDYVETKTTGVPPSEVLKWFTEHPPRTHQGICSYIQALKTIPLAKRLPILKKIWYHQLVPPETEDILYQTLKAHVTSSDIAKRAHLYLDHHQPYEAKKWLKMLKSVDKKAVLDRLHFQIKTPSPSPLLSDPRVLLEAISYYRHQKDPKAITLLKSNKKKLYHFNAAQTWKEIHILIRRAFEAGDYALALSLLKGHQGLKGTAAYADALWLEGWLEGKVHRNFNLTLNYFKAMYSAVKTPISKSKAAFWVGQTYEQLSKKALAQEWFQKASCYPTTFYGQEALIKLKKPLYLPPLPQPTAKDKQAFNNRLLVKVAKLLPGTPFEKELSHFLFMVIKTSPTYGQALLALELAQKHSPYEVVGLAKETTLRFHKEVYGVLSYPLLPPALRHLVTIDPALAHAVIRKESGFNPSRISPVGARGLMQVMPDTGRMLAKEKNLSFSQEKLLKDPAFNISLGCSYLKRNLQTYDNDLLLTLSAYNAGPKHAAAWQEAFGNPRTSSHHRLIWVEIIPFSETRSYIHRVIEALRIYQLRLKVATS